MRLALISDIHGNRHALEAVVADAGKQPVDGWWALGDLVAIGPEPVRTLELLANLPAVRITRGNTERYVLSRLIDRRRIRRRWSHDQSCSSSTARSSNPRLDRRRHRGVRWRSWLVDLELEVRARLPDGTDVLGVHASPGRDDGDGMTPHRSAHELQREMDDACAQLVFAGHTHQPTDREVGGVRAVDLGSVSNSITDDLRASYVILHSDRHGHHVEHRRVRYDRDAFLEVVARSGHPAADYIASFQRGQQVRFPAQRPGAPTPST